MKCILSTLKPYRGGIQGLGCIEAGRVLHIDYVYVEAISNTNALMKFDRN